MRGKNEHVRRRKRSRKLRGVSSMCLQTRTDKGTSSLGKWRFSENPRKELLTDK